MTVIRLRRRWPEEGKGREELCNIDELELLEAEQRGRLCMCSIGNATISSLDGP